MAKTMTIKINTIGIIAKDKSNAVSKTINTLVNFFTEKSCNIILDNSADGLVENTITVDRDSLAKESDAFQKSQKEMGTIVYVFYTRTTLNLILHLYKNGFIFVQLFKLNGARNCRAKVVQIPPLCKIEKIERFSETFPKKAKTNGYNFVYQE